MSVAVSNRVQSIKPSPTMALTAQAAELRAGGKDVIGLAAGEPDFDTPEHIKAAAIQAIGAGQTKYTAVDGTPGLKQAIIDKFQRDNGLKYGADQILVSCGGKQTCFNVCQAVLNPGDEVVIPAPYWVSYPDMVKLADGYPVIVPAGAEQGFKISAEQLEEALSDRTRLLILNSPCNPSGAAYTRAELVAFGEVLANYPDIVIATDDMYEHIYWGSEPFCSLVTACPSLYDRTVTINGVSKAYAMTGWRIGYAGGPANVIRAMEKVQSQCTSNPCSISQAASEAALNGDQSCVADMTREFKRRHDYIIRALNGIPGFDCRPCAGTFYAFPDVSRAISNSGFENDAQLGEFLLNDAMIATVPGSAFGSPGYLRLSFAAGLATLEDAVQRINRSLSV